MSEQQGSHAPGADPVDGEPSAQQPTQGRVSTGGMIGGAIMFALLYAIDKFRPSNWRNSGKEESVEQKPAADTPAAGSYETMTGTHPAPPGVHETIASVWPMVVAGAVAFTAFGIVTNYAFSVFGIVALIIGIVGWVGELIRE